MVANLLRLYEKDAADPRLEAHARTLYDLAVIAEGSRVKDPSAGEAHRGDAGQGRGLNSEE